MKWVPRNSDKSYKAVRTGSCLPHPVLMALVISLLGIPASPVAGSSGDIPGEPAAILTTILFYSPGCGGCQVVKGVLKEAKLAFGGRINVKMRNIDNIEVYKELIKYEEKYGSKENETLKIFVGSRYIAGPDNIVKKLQQVIKEELAKGSVTYNPGKSDTIGNLVGKEDKKTQAALVPIIGRFRNFRLLAVMGAGLIDGINPCAFTSIVFFISMLTYLGRSRRDILLVGIFFALAVFLTYLMLGLGAFKAIKVFSVSNKISSIITYLTATAAFVLGGYSLYDYIIFKKTQKPSKMKLQLPKAVKRKIQDIMQKKLRSRNLIIGAFVVGFLVSLLEAVCTGQVYLPTIVFVMKEPSLRVHAFFYLVIYNLMFIVPLLLVIAFVFGGLSSTRLISFAEGNLGFTKILLSIVFIGLGVLLVATH